MNPAGIIHKFLQEVIFWIDTIKYGNTLQDKFNLLCIPLLIPTPIIWSKLPFFILRLKNKVRKLIYLHTILNIDGCLYRLIDGSSVGVIMPYYERQMLPFIKLESDNVFIDVGAHIGKYTIYAARKCKIVIAIEPDPINFRVLLSNIRLNNLQNVIALNIAAYDKEDKIRLYTAEGSLGASIKINRDLGYTEVDAKPLDTVLEVLGVNKVDLVKIDVERSECEVLKGMKRILIEWHPRLIIEVWNENWSSIKDFLCELGYGIKEIEGMKSHEAFYVYCSRK